jgi:DNA-binding NarL/FixJ family response regulator
MLNINTTREVAIADPVREDCNVIGLDASRKARVLLAADQLLIAEALSLLLAPHFDTQRVTNDPELIAGEIARCRPDVVLLYITVPGLDAARTILNQAPKTKIVFVTMHTNRAILKEAFRVGASGFVAKSCTACDLVRAIRTVLRGGTYHLSPEAHDKDTDYPEALTHRQITVLGLVAQGCSAKEIGFVLRISSRTAEYHKNSIMEKLKIRTTAQLTRYAIENGIA